MPSVRHTPAAVDCASETEKSRIVSHARPEHPPSTQMAITRDAFLGGAVIACQPAKGYRAGLDAVLLAASVPEPGFRVTGGHTTDSAHRPCRLLDVGAGVGVVGLCVAARLGTAEITLVEKSPELCALAATNISANPWSARLRIIEHDVLHSPTLPVDGLDDNSFDVTVSNPPFYDASDHRQSPHALKAASHAMPDAGLDRWLRFMARKTRHGGMAIMIHRADQLPAVLAAFSPRFGDMAILPLHPRAGEPACRVIIRGTKGSRAPLRMLPGICLHSLDNRFTPEIDRILKTPASLAANSGT